jgi:DNA-binding NarL/FixJ family response regulator
VERRSGPIRLAIVDDYDIVVAGVAHMFADYTDRIAVVDLAADEPVTVDVDIALFDTFAQAEADAPDLDVVLANPLASRVAVYTWVFDEGLVAKALAKGVRGYLSKTLPANQLVDALEQICDGQVVVSAPPADPVVAQDWPGRAEGLTARESEMLALIAQGKTNAEIASMTYLSPNSVKTYIRAAYAKIGVSSRTKAVLWGVEHGLHVGRRRIDDWRRDLPAGLGRPATSALVQIGVTTLEQVARLSATELLALHGVGPKAVRILEAELAERGMALAAAGETTEQAEQARISRR